MSTMYAEWAARRGRRPLNRGLAVESPWVLVGRACAPFPLWGFVLSLGLPGSPLAAEWLHGPFAFGLTLGAMVLWVHRPPFLVGVRWMASVTGAGLMAELLLDGLGRQAQLEAFGAPPLRALTVLLTAVIIYEAAPTLAAASGIMRKEWRRWVLDAPAYLLFAGLAVLAALGRPPRGGAVWLWAVSPWVAAAVAMPLAAARSGPLQRPLGGTTGRAWPLAAIGVLLLACSSVLWLHRPESAEAAALLARRVGRTGLSPAAGVLLVLPIQATVSFLLAALTLVARRRRLAGAPDGVVVDLGPDRLTLADGPTGDGPWPVAMAPSELAEVEVGDAVTLVDAAPADPGAGPFRDGAPAWHAGSLRFGSAVHIRAGLAARAAGWVFGAGLAAAGALMTLLQLR